MPAGRGDLLLKGVNMSGHSKSTFTPNSFDTGMRKIFAVFEGYVRSNEPGFLAPIREQAYNMELKASKIARAQSIVNAVTGDTGWLAMRNKDTHPSEEWVSAQLDNIGELVALKKVQETTQLAHLGTTSGSFDEDIEFVLRVLTLMREGEFHNTNRRVKFGPCIETFALGLKYELGTSNIIGVKSLELTRQLVTFLLGIMMDIIIDQAKVEKLHTAEEVSEIIRRGVLRSIYRSISAIKPYVSEKVNVTDLINIVGSLLTDARDCSEAEFMSRHLVSRAATSLVETVTAPLSFLPGYSSLPALFSPSETEFMVKYRLGLEQIQAAALQQQADMVIKESEEQFSSAKAIATPSL